MLNLLLITDRGLVEILNLHLKQKNIDHSSRPKSTTGRTMFFKMKNFPMIGFLRISTSENKKKV